MNRHGFGTLLVLAGLLVAASPLRAATGKPFEWQTATPESQGMSREELDALKDSLAARMTKAFLVIRNDRIVYEWYATDHAATKTHYNDAPYPRSRAITRIDWAAKETIVRHAKGSDNWPMTWADDDHLYTAYGDGWGFVPMTREKLSLGFARVEGGPERFTGANIRSATGEHKGEGAKGKKASGILMIDGVLYMLARNAGNSQLAWSKDQGTTWTWSDWKFTTSFGCPTFLNFGKNYAGARDEYVYVYSHDNASAYETADRMVLARVAKAKIKDRDAYEFFKGLDATGGPLWTGKVSERGAVFAYKGNCHRSGISYNAWLKRYLWCQVLPRSKDERGPRFQGGFGVYEAPEPWGPWATVYWTEAWDVGPGETSSFPTKWMSGDGKSLGRNQRGAHS